MDSRNEKELHEALAELLGQSVHENVIPGAVVAVSRIHADKDPEKIIHVCGYTERSEKREPVTETTVFDLASLTKPLVVVISLLHLLQQRKITLDSTLVELLPLVGVPEDKKGIQLWQLLSHCSGLPAHRPYFVSALGIRKTERKAYFIRSILAEPLAYPPGKRHIYSDLGYILLGAAIEQLTSRSLDVFYSEYVLKPLGLTEMLSFIPVKKAFQSGTCAATEVCPWTNRLLAGIVHDDNCRVMGGVAGHAGLFGTAGGVLNVCTLLCGVWKGWTSTELFSRDLLRTFLTRRKGTTWTCGFDTPSTFHSSSGSRFSSSSVGHLGYTGTSLWLDLERGISVVLLTNRVHPVRSNDGIRLLRPRAYDVVMERLIG